MSFIPTLDRATVLSWNQFVSSHSALAALVSTIAVYGVYVIPLVWLIWWFVTGKRQREVLLSSFLAGALAWQVLNRIVKAFFFVHGRPMDELDVHKLPVKELLFNRPGASFPSDHAAFLGGVAFFFLLRGQRVTGVWLIVLALLVTGSRVAMAAHYPSDIVVGLFDGFLMAWIVNLVHERLSETFWRWCMNIARTLHLA